MPTFIICKDAHCRQAAAGFTLLEMLVTLAIVSLVGLVTTPFIGNSLDKMRVKHGAMEITSALKLARQQAIQASSETTVLFDLAAGSLTTDRTVDLHLPEEAQISLITASSEQTAERQGAIRFFKDGSSTGGQVELSFRNQLYLVQVEWLNGHVSLE